MKNDLQQLAETLRNAAYSDDQSHKLDWTIYIVHPKTNNGDVGFSGGIWSNGGKEYKSLHLSFSETTGINDVHIYTEKSEIYPQIKKIDNDALKALIKKHFGITQFYNEKP